MAAVTAAEERAAWAEHRAAQLQAKNIELEAAVCCVQWPVPLARFGSTADFCNLDQLVPVHEAAAAIDEAGEGEEELQDDEPTEVWPEEQQVVHLEECADGEAATFIEAVA